MKSIRNIKIVIFGNLWLLAGLLAVNQVGAQIICTQLGAFTSCDYGSSQFIQADLGSNMGAIIGPTTTTPYVVIPSTTRPQHQPAPVFQIEPYSARLSQVEPGSARHEPARGLAYEHQSNHRHTYNPEPLPPPTVSTLDSLYYSAPMPYPYGMGE